MSSATVDNRRLPAALAAGRTRLRPVIMTALAMIIGMLPMSLGLGDGGEQNAPLGRAVIGGLTGGNALHASLRAGGLQRAAQERQACTEIDPLLFEPDEYEITDVAEVTGRENAAGIVDRRSGHALREQRRATVTDDSDCLIAMSPLPMTIRPVKVAVSPRSQAKVSDGGSPAARSRRPAAEQAEAPSSKRKRQKESLRISHFCHSAG